MSNNVSLTDRITALIGPLFVLYQAIKHFLFTLVSRPLLLLHDFEAFQSSAFASLWNAYGSELSSGVHEAVPPLLWSVRGTVLDLGPGTGEQLHKLDATKITRCYGIEPVEKLHDKLKQAATAAGFGVSANGEYVPLVAGAEPQSLVPALAGAGAIEASGSSSAIFDEILAVRVLCGIPQPEETLQTLYSLLKPGGRIVFYEHVLNQYELPGRLAQAIYHFMGWKFFMGGCCMDRDTGKMLKEAAGTDGWKEIKLDVVRPWAAIPYIVGYMVK